MIKPGAFPRTLGWLLVTTLSTASLTGCIAGLGENTKTQSAVDSNTLPNWVISPPRDNTHLYGVGSAPRIDNLALAFSQAEQNGNAQIAQQLRSQVSQVNTQDTQVSSQSGQAEQVRRINSAYTQVKTAPIELEHTVNEERFAGEDYVYVLQSIDRQRIVAKLRMSIQDVDDSIRKAAKNLTLTPDNVANPQEWRTYMSLIPLFAQRKSDQDELNLYSNQSGLSGRADSDIQDIEHRLTLALDQFGFNVKNTDQADALASALSQYGLTAKDPAIFVLTSVTSSHQKTQQDRFYVFEEGTLSLTGPNHQHLASWDVTGRGIDNNQQSASHKAEQDWAQQAVKALFSWLTERTN